jgi:hypothetical protein
MSHSEATCSCKRLYELIRILDYLNAKFSSVYTLECDVSIDESLMMHKGHQSRNIFIPLKHARFGIKSFELQETKSGYVWNFIIYIGQDTAFNESRKNGSKVVL